MCLCAVNDFPRPPALCGPPCLRPGRNKQRIVMVGEQQRKRAEGRGRRKGGIHHIENKQGLRVQRPARTPTPSPPKIPLFPLSLFLFLCLLFFSWLLSPHLSALSFPLCLVLVWRPYFCSLFPWLFVFACVLFRLTSYALFLFLSIYFLLRFSRHLCENVTLVSEASACLPHRQTWKPNIYLWACVTVML